MARRKTVNGTNVARMKRLDLVEQMVLKGETNQTKIAMVFGLSQPQIHKDILEIQRRWAEQDAKKSSYRRAVAVHRLELTAWEMWQAWERSKNNEEEITTKYIPHPCEACSGKGKLKGRNCECCDGTGMVNEEVVTKRVKGKPGDSEFMREFRGCVMDIAKIQGSIIGQGQKQKKLGGEEIGNGTFVFNNVQLDLSKAEPDTLFKAKQALLQLSENVRAKMRSDEDAIDAKSADGDDGVRNTKGSKENEDA